AAFAHEDVDGAQPAVTLIGRNVKVPRGRIGRGDSAFRGDVLDERWRVVVAHLGQGDGDAGVLPIGRRGGAPTTVSVGQCRLSHRRGRGACIRGGGDGGRRGGRRRLRGRGRGALTHRGLAVSAPREGPEHCDASDGRNHGDDGDRRTGDAVLVLGC